MRRLLRLVSDVSLTVLLGGLTAVIICFGIGYWALEGAHAGLEFSYATPSAPSLLDALYFSLVTISSLGYGDIRPIGVSRLLVGAEVIIGLSFFGLIVSKISSVRQDYILRRLYSEKVEVEVRRYNDELEKDRELYRITSGLLLAGEIGPLQTTTFQGGVKEVSIFYRLQQLAVSVRDMMTFEEHNNALFGDVPDSTIGRLYSGFQDVLAHTEELWTTDGERACDLVFCGNSESIEGMLEPLRDMANLGLRASRNDAIKTQCRFLLDRAGFIHADVLPQVREREVACALPSGHWHSSM